MTRRAITFPCGGVKLYGMLDCAAAHGQTGLLIVSGGNEIRAGAFAGQARLAARLAETAGVPVFRFDRRGIGDSDGDNTGWRGSRNDIAAALGTFRAAMPAMRRVIGFGLCDAAGALMLHAATLEGLDGLVLGNPWTIEADEAGHSPAALRQRYWAKLTDPRSLGRLLRGRIDLRKLFHGLGLASRRNPTSSPLADQLYASLAQFSGPATLLVAAGDRAGQRFREVWPASDPRLTIHPGRSHSFTDDPDSTNWLFDRLIEATASRH